MSDQPLVSGTVRPQFTAVRDAFERGFRKHGELGASLCVYQDGECVVDLWGGVANRRSERAWEADTLGVMFSATKGMAATCLLMLHDRGQLDYDAPVTRYWPEFGAAGKDGITVRQMLNHTAGVVAVERELSLRDLEDPQAISRALERQRPLWAPGERQGYHGVTYGLFVGELFRRIAGESIGTFLHREVAQPLQADVFLGLPPEEDARTATLYPQGASGFVRHVLPRVAVSRGNEGRVFRSALFERDSMTARAFRQPRDLGALGVSNFNRRRVQRQELPWANAMGTARGIARVYHGLANPDGLDGVKLVSPESAALPRQRDSFAYDAVLHRDMGFSFGFVKENPGIFGPHSVAFGHPGAGGALGWADPESRLSIGYVPNKMDFRIRSKRALALCEAIYDCL